MNFLTSENQCTAFTHIERFQTVPAKGMLAVLTHHLGTAFISFNVNFTLWTALDWSIVFFHLKN